jgi:acyl carrier protein
LPLDYFVMFSSIAAVFPQRGQGTYSAANRFLDWLAAYRRSLGLPGLSLNWGGWKNTGLAKRAAGARSTVLAMARRGMPAMKPGLALDAMNHAMRGTSPNLLVTPIDAVRTCHFYEGQRIPTLLRQLTSSATAVASPQSGALSLVDELKQAASADARRDLLENMLKEQVSRVLRISPARVDRMKPFGQMGLDSLMSVEFINRLRSGLSVSLTSTAAFNYPTVARLAVHLAGKLGVLLEEDSSSLANVPASSSITNVAVEGLSEEEAIQALIGGGAPLQTAESGS